MNEADRDEAVAARGGGRGGSEWESTWKGALEKVTLRRRLSFNSGFPASDFCSVTICNMHLVLVLVLELICKPRSLRVPFNYSSIDESRLQFMAKSLAGQDLLACYSNCYLLAEGDRAAAQLPQCLTITHSVSHSVHSFIHSFDWSCQAVKCAN